MGPLRSKGSRAVEPLERRALLCGWVVDEAAPHDADADAIRRAAIGIGAEAQPVEYAAPPLASVAGQTTLRVEAGASSGYTDTFGKIWSADAGFAGGAVSTNAYPVADTDNDLLYYTRRWGKQFTYSLPVTNGDYTLRLLMADPLYTAPGQRVFHVDAEGVRLLSDFDLAASGGVKTAFMRSFPVTVADARLNLTFSAEKDNAIVSAFELTPRQTTTPLPDRLRVDAARTTAYTDAAGNVWSKDAGFSGGMASTSAFAVAGTGDDSLYYTRRFGASFNYALPVASGDYTLRLHFTEPAFHEAGKRTFNVDAEGARVLSNFDLVAAGGGSAAVVRSFNVTVRDNKLDLAFRGVVQNAIVSAIELTPRAAALTWRSGAAAPIGRFEAQGAAAGGKLYVLGGFYNNAIQATARCDVYDPATNTWKRLADMPAAITHAGTAVDGAVIWIAGGFVGDHPGPSTNAVYKYDTRTNRWTAGPALPAARGGGALVRLGRNLHYFGGTVRDAKGKYLLDSPDHWVLNLDSTTPRWTAKAPLPNPRNHLGGAAVGGKVYAVGGQHLGDEFGGNLSDVHAYDPTANRWTAVKALPLRLGHVTANVFVRNNRVTVAGGVTDNSVEVADVLEYDAAANQWLALPPLPGARQSPVADVIDGRIIVTGGRKDGMGVATTTWIGTAPGA